MPAPLLIEPGQRFGRWTVESEADRPPGKRRRMLCRCDCGTRRPVDLSTLSGGESRSCGCLKREQSRESARRRRRLSVQRGQRFGRLVVIREERTHPTPGEPYGIRVALCQCDCGTQTVAPIKQLVSGGRRSCGCLRRSGELLIEWRADPANYAQFLETLRRSGEARRRLTVSVGQRFGRLTVINASEVRDRQGARAVRCRCDCDGHELVATIKHLYSGNTRGCGCLNREARIQRNKSPENRARVGARVRTHGLSKHPQYGIWKAMISRCHNPDDPAYQWYGAKGVTVCKQWRDVRDFIAWVEANPRPDDGRRMVNGGGWYSIDRINVFGNYEPGNVRWASWEQQAVNKREVSADMPEPPMECPACGEMSRSESAFDRHYRQEHKQMSTATATKQTEDR